MIVAHSWGTVVAHQALEQLQESTKLAPGSVALLVTLGSPLGTQCRRMARTILRIQGVKRVEGYDLIGAPDLRRPDTAAHWLNLWVEADKISGPLGSTQGFLAAAGSDLQLAHELDGQIRCDSETVVQLGTEVLALLKTAHNAYQQKFAGVLADSIKAALDGLCTNLLWAGGSSLPAGFGVPYNTTSSERELVLRADCVYAKWNSEGHVRVEAGAGEELQYIYKQGFEWTAEGWSPITFEGEAPVDGSWYVGEAQAQLARTADELEKPNYVVAYICSWTGTEWKCGCRDERCNDSFWQLQAFQAR